MYPLLTISAGSSSNDTLELRVSRLPLASVDRNVGSMPSADPPRRRVVGELGLDLLTPPDLKAELGERRTAAPIFAMDKVAHRKLP